MDFRAVDDSIPLVPLVHHLFDSLARRLALRALSRVEYVVAALAGSVAFGALFAAAGGPLSILPDGDESNWRVERLRSGAFDGVSLAVDGETPHVAYFSSHWSDRQASTVSYTRREDGEWQERQTVRADRAYTFAGVHIGHGDGPRVVYHEGRARDDPDPYGPSSDRRGDYMFSTRTRGTRWSAEKVLGSLSGQGLHFATRRGPDGDMHVLAANKFRTTGSAIYAHRTDGGEWRTEKCRFTEQPTGSISPVIGPDGAAYVFRHLERRRGMLLNRIDEGSCDGTPILEDETVSAHWSEAAAVDGEGRLYVYYADPQADGSTHRLGIREDGRWRSQPVREMAYPYHGITGADLEVTDDGGVHIAYRGTSERLGYTTRRPDSDQWQAPDLLRERAQKHFDLAVASDETPHLVYLHKPYRSGIIYARLDQLPR